MLSQWIEAPSFIAQLWRAGGAGAVSLLPLLSWFAQFRTSQEVIYSREELTRLAGCSGTALDRGRAAFESLGLATTHIVKKHGQPVLAWRVGGQLRIPIANERFDPAFELFYFPMRWIFGGQWAMLKPAERAVLMVLGIKARQLGEFEASEILERRTRFDTDLSRLRAEPGTRKVRLVQDLSQSEIALAAGLNVRSVEKAVGRWRVGPVLPRWEDASASWPVHAYPTESGNLVYHVRPHAAPWPWGHLNGSTRGEVEAERR